MSNGMGTGFIANNVGFVSTRLAGTDGVSLETDKWAAVFEKEGLSCYFFAGELDSPPDRSYLAEEAHFKHPVISDISKNCFGVRVRSRFVTQKIVSTACRITAGSNEKLLLGTTSIERDWA